MKKDAIDDRAMPGIEFRPGVSYGVRASRGRLVHPAPVRTPRCGRGSRASPWRGFASQRYRIGVAPSPVLPRLHRFDDRMTHRVVVRRGMLVRRRIAATDVAAGHADAQVHPAIPGPQAVFTAARARHHALDLVEVPAAYSRFGL